jgi:hypothetical protein
MDVGRFTSSLGKVGILRSIQELAMTRMSDHVSLTGGITNSNVEITSWSNGGLDLLDLKNSSNGLGGEDVDLNMPQFFGKICRKSIKPFSKARAKKSKIVDKISDKIVVLKRDGIKIVLVENNL